MPALLRPGLDQVQRRAARCRRGPAGRRPRAARRCSFSSTATTADRLGGQQHRRGEQGRGGDPLDGGHAAAGRADPGGGPGGVADQALGELVVVEAGEVPAQRRAVADRHVRRDVGDHVGHPAQRRLGPEQLAQPAAADVADQAAEQLAPAGGLEVVGGERRDGLAQLVVGLGLVGARGSTRARRRRTGRRLAAARLGRLRVAHRRPPRRRSRGYQPMPGRVLESKPVVNTRVTPGRPTARRRPGGGACREAPVRRTRGRSAPRCVPRPAGCGGARGNNGRSGTRRTASAAP